MLTTAVIAFREFFEALLIVGIFLGISKKLGLKRELEIALATLLGISVTVILCALVYLLGNDARALLTERSADAVESYLLIFSGLFLAYIVLSLHKTISRGREAMLGRAKERLSASAFDISLFFLIAFLVVREGFEIALFTASVSLFSAFAANLVGLLLGLLAASVLGLSTFFAFIEVPIGKIFRWAEYLIIFLGAALTQNGITLFLDTHFGIDLGQMFPFGFGFLPNEDTFVGNLLQGFLGIDQDFSGVRLLLMLLYIAVVYMLFSKRKRAKAAQV